MLSAPSTLMTPTHVEKRKQYNETEEGQRALIEFKRQKTADVDLGAAILGTFKDVKRETVDQSVSETTVGANELASAFALASLASMSPLRNNSDKDASKRNVGELGFGYESRDADDDANSELSHNQEIPVSVTPETRSPNRNRVPAQCHRRVTFSNDTKGTSRVVSRRLSLPPRIGDASRSRQPQQPQRNHLTNELLMRRHFYPSPHHQQHSPQPYPRSPPHQLWMRQHPNYRHNKPPATLYLPNLQQQQHVRTPPQLNTNNAGNDNMNQHKWICDFCNVASFATYEEACEHEKCCRTRINTAPCTPQLNYNIIRAMPSHMPPWPPSAQHMHTRMERGPQQPYLTTSHPMVGGTPPPPPPPLYMRRTTSVDTPSSPQQNDMRRLVETAYTTISPNISPGTTNTKSVRHTISSQESSDMTDGTDGSYTLSPGTTDGQQQQQQLPILPEKEIEGTSITLLDDMEIVPPYVYFLMRQVESTQFTEADRFVARSKGPVGYAGFQCRHCHGHAGLGKYFPVTAKSLSTNSTSQNIHSHLLKCRKVPPYLKDQLVTLKDEKSRSPRLEPGWRRIFFEKIWSRLHD
jgi:hypothetical protein